MGIGGERVGPPAAVRAAGAGDHRVRVEHHLEDRVADELQALELLAPTRPDGLHRGRRQGPEARCHRRPLPRLECRVAGGHRTCPPGRSIGGRHIRRFCPPGRAGAHARHARDPAPTALPAQPVTTPATSARTGSSPPAAGDTGNSANSTPPDAAGPRAQDGRGRQHDRPPEGDLQPAPGDGLVDAELRGSAPGGPPAVRDRPREPEGLGRHGVHVDRVDVPGHPAERAPGPLGHRDRAPRPPTPPRSRAAGRPTPRHRWPSGCGTGRSTWSASRRAPPTLTSPETSNSSPARTCRPSDTAARTSQGPPTGTLVEDVDDGPLVDQAQGPHRERPLGEQVDVQRHDRQLREGDRDLRTGAHQGSVGREPLAIRPPAGDHGLRRGQDGGRVRRALPRCHRAGQAQRVVRQIRAGRLVGGAHRDPFAAGGGHCLGARR